MNVHIHENDEIPVWFDIFSLFTKVPVSEAVAICERLHAATC